MAICACGTLEGIVLPPSGLQTVRRHPAGTDVSGLTPRLNLHLSKAKAMGLGTRNSCRSEGGAHQGCKKTALTWDLNKSLAVGLPGTAVSMPVSLSLYEVRVWLGRLKLWFSAAENRSHDAAPWPLRRGGLTCFCVNMKTDSWPTLDEGPAARRARGSLSESQVVVFQGKKGDTFVVTGRNSGAEAEEIWKQ